jgi:hypothetical protein
MALRQGEAKAPDMNQQWQLALAWSALIRNRVCHIYE